MKKGNFGIQLCLYTILAFIMAYFGNATVLFLLAGAVIFLERDEWAGRQVIQAIGLYFARTLINIFWNFINSGFHSILSFFSGISQITKIWNMGDTIVDFIVAALMLVFCIVGILNNMKGKDANIIGVSKLADWAYGTVNASKDAK